MKFAAHALTALLASCGCHSQANTEVQPNAALIVFPDASSVRYSVGAGTVVEYVVTMAFPAEEALASISRSLAATGWHPSRMDLLNPTIESSHVRGWSRFVDSTEAPAVRVHQWQGDWTNDAGEAVTYSLQYRSSDRDAERPTNGSLHVTATFMSADQVRQDGLVLPKRPGP
jgi:hypothetical protein